MLRGVVLHLAGKPGTVVSVVARKRTGLENLARMATGVRGRVEPLAVDYRNDAAFRSALRGAIALDGPVRIVVCWIRDPEDEPLRAVIESVRSQKSADIKKVLLVHVMGSVAADPSKTAPRAPIPKNDPRIEYRRVILGFKIEERRSRWLNDDEISEGVIGALTASEAETIVGVVQPWSSRPVTP